MSIGAGTGLQKCPLNAGKGRRRHRWRVRRCLVRGTRNRTAQDKRMSAAGEFIDRALQREGAWYRADDAAASMAGVSAFGFSTTGPR